MDETAFFFSLFLLFFYVNAHEKDMNLSILSARSKLWGKVESLALVSQIDSKENF